MHAYNEAYLDDVVENQGKLFDFIATNYPDKDTEEFIKAYMSSKTRQSIDESQAYLSTGLTSKMINIQDIESFTLQFKENFNKFFNKNLHLS